MGAGQDKLYQYIGQLFIETRLELERLVEHYKSNEAKLKEQITKLENERDSALAMLHHQKNAG